MNNTNKIRKNAKPQLKSENKKGEKNLYLEKPGYAKGIKENYQEKEWDSGEFSGNPRNV